MRRASRFIAAAVVVALTSVGRVAAAQDVDAKVDAWAAGLELALNAARGNSSYTMLTSGLRLTHLNKKAFELDWSSGITYGESNDKVIARRLVTTFKADGTPEATISPFAFGSAERDRIRRLNLLTSAGVGAKWTYFRNTRGKASISAAVLHTYKNIEPAATASTAVEPKASTARISLRPKVAQRWASGFSIEQTSFWQPVIGDFNDYNVEAATRIAFAASKTKTLFTQHTYRNDSKPPSGVKREDQILVAGIKLAF